MKLALMTLGGSVTIDRVSYERIINKGTIDRGQL